jgi:hypothetical protein
VYWLKTNAISQNMIQRYLSLPNLAAAKRFVHSGFSLKLICCGISRGNQKKKVAAWDDSLGGWICWKRLKLLGKL